MTALTAAALIISSNGRVWNPALHPRDRKGRFIETYAEVRAFLRKSSKKADFAGRVVAMDPDGTVVVQVSHGTGIYAHPEMQGRLVRISSKNIEALSAKAHIRTAPGSAPEGSDTLTPLPAKQLDSVSRAATQIATKSGVDLGAAPDANDAEAQLEYLERVADAAEKAKIPAARDALLDYRSEIRHDPNAEDTVKEVRALLPEAYKTDIPALNSKDATPEADKPDTDSHTTTAKDYAARNADEQRLAAETLRLHREASAAAREQKKRDAAAKKAAKQSTPTPTPTPEPDADAETDPGADDVTEPDTEDTPEDRAARAEELRGIAAGLRRQIADRDENGRSPEGFSNKQLNAIDANEAKNLETRAQALEDGESDPGEGASATKNRRTLAEARARLRSTAADADAEPETPGEKLARLDEQAATAKAARIALSKDQATERDRAYFNRISDLTNEERAAKAERYAEVLEAQVCVCVCISEWVRVEIDR